MECRAEECGGAWYRVSSDVHIVSVGVVSVPGEEQAQDNDKAILLPRLQAVCDWANTGRCTRTRMFRIQLTLVVLV